MADLLKKSNKVCIVIRKVDLDISTRDKLIKKWCEENCYNYAYIYHMKDINPETHLEENPHCHIVAVLKQCQRLSTTLNSLCEAVNLTTLGVEIDKCNSLEGSIQYLIHKNDPQKTSHELKDIISNYDAVDLRVIIETECDSLTPERLRALVKNSTTNYELIKALGIERYNRLRKVISDIRDDFRIWNY